MRRRRRAGKGGRVLENPRDADIYSAEGGWFQARWHFSFDSYRDPMQRGVGPLRVFNDDRLVAGADWPMHPHADVEGLTYVVEGRSSTPIRWATAASCSPAASSA